MSRISPTLEGFRAAFRRPGLTFGEILWRWSFGATTVALLLFGFFEYLATLPVTNGELFFLRTRHPFFVAQALAHILHGSLYRAVISLLVAALMLLLFVGGVMNLWWIAGLTIFVLLEKTIPFGDVTGRFAGAAMILVGALSLAL